MMKIINCIQGDAAWTTVRCGRITGSRISDIITINGKQTANAARQRYMIELAGERIIGTRTEHYQTSAMRRGSELEQQARMWYQIATADTVEEVGFCLHENDICGVSPDGLVGDDGGIEIKCPLLPRYLDIMQKGPSAIDSAWQLQCHCGMAVTGRAWWDFVLYTDVEPLGGWIHRIERNEEMCEAIMNEVTVFDVEVNAAVAAIKQRAGL